MSRTEKEGDLVNRLPAKMFQVSFHETQDEYETGTKDLTRRVRWRVKPGYYFMGVDQMQGIPKGGHRTKIGPSLVITVQEEKASAVVDNPVRKDRNGVMRSEVVREGFPAFEGQEEKFLTLLLKINKGLGLKRDSIIKRVEFQRIFQ